MSERSMPPPMGARPRTLGQVRENNGRNSGADDLAEGRRDTVTDDQLRQLVDQKQRLENTPPPSTRGNIQPNMPPPSDNVTERRVQLPPDRVRTRLPEVPEDGVDRAPLRSREEILADLKGRRVTNEDTTGPQTPPPISPAQYAAQRQRDADEAKQDEKAEVYTGKPRFVLKEPKRDSKYTRVPLLSGFVFYPWKDVQVRRFNLSDQIKISRAQAERNLTAFMDAVGATLADGIDIRSFAPQDFRFLLYWHRFNSYTTTPFIVTWTSKYGNRNQYKIENTSITYQPPTMTEDEFAEWSAKGFAMPTMRDLEVFEQENLNDEETYLFNKAQWFKGIPNEEGVVDIQEKLDHMAELTADSLDILGDLQEFQTKSDFKVIERIDVVDKQFDAAKYATQLAEQAAYLRREAGLVQQSNSALYVSRMQEADAVEKQSKDITEKLAKGGEVKPDVETITLNIGFLDFFPNL